MSQEFALIEDGYSVETTIARVPGLYPAVRVRFRPALAEERDEWLLKGQRDFAGRDRTARAADIVARHLEQWDVRTRAGGEVRPDAATVRKLHPSLLQKLLDLVLGYEPIQEAGDAKNSSPASTS